VFTIKSHEPIPFKEIQAARKRIQGEVVRTPLVRLDIDSAPTEIYLKLETLQPIRSFKIRGAVNIMKMADPKQLEAGVWAASAGNWAQGIAWYARKLGVNCTIIIPETAPHTKQDAIKRLGAQIIPVTYNQWLDTFRTRQYEGMDGLFLHAFSDPAVMAGNGTIGLEIIDDLPDVDAVVIPWGGGGLCSGIASAIRVLKPNVKIYACEVETAAPLAASLMAGKPIEIKYTPSFVDGIGAPSVFPEMWNLAHQLLDGSLVVGLDDTTEVVRKLIERNCIIAAGAGAVPVAAALAGKAGSGKIACIVSGGNLDVIQLIKILQGNVP